MINTWRWKAPPSVTLHLLRATHAGGIPRARSGAGCTLSDRKCLPQAWLLHSRWRTAVSGGGEGLRAPWESVYSVCVCVCVCDSDITST